jgi:hypothetical protein
MLDVEGLWSIRLSVRRSGLGRCDRFKRHRPAHRPLAHVRLKARALRVGVHARTTVKLGSRRRSSGRSRAGNRLRLLLVARVKDPAGHVRTVRKGVTVRLRRP